MKKSFQEKLTNFLITTLDKSQSFTYEIVEIEGDDDINFMVSPKLKSLKAKDKDKLNFLLYCSDESMLTIYCPNLYVLGDKDTLIGTLNNINIVNSKIAVGKIYLNKINNSRVNYINRILFNNIYNELTIDLLEEYINSYLATCVEFYKQMKAEL